MIYSSKKTAMLRGTFIILCSLLSTVAMAKNTSITIFNYTNLPVTFPIASEQCVNGTGSYGQTVEPGKSALFTSYDSASTSGGCDIKASSISATLTVGSASDNISRAMYTPGESYAGAYLNYNATIIGTTPGGSNVYACNFDTPSGAPSGSGWENSEAVVWTEDPSSNYSQDTVIPSSDESTITLPNDQTVSGCPAGLITMVYTINNNAAETVYAQPSNLNNVSFTPGNSAPANATISYWPSTTPGANGQTLTNNYLPIPHGSTTFSVCFAPQTANGTTGFSPSVQISTTATTDYSNNQTCQAVSPFTFAYSSTPCADSLTSPFSFSLSASSSISPNCQTGTASGSSALPPNLQMWYAATPTISAVKSATGYPVMTADIGIGCSSIEPGQAACAIATGS